MMKSLASVALVAALFAAPSGAASLDVGVGFYGGILTTSSTEEGYVPGTIFGTQRTSGVNTDTYTRAGAAAVAGYGTLGAASTVRSVLDHRGGNFNNSSAGFARLHDVLNLSGPGPTTRLALDLVIDIAEDHDAPYYPGEDWQVDRTGITYTDVHDDYGNETYAILALAINNFQPICYQAPGSSTAFNNYCQNSLMHIGRNTFQLFLDVPTYQPFALNVSLLADTRQFRPANDAQGAYTNGTIDAGIFALGTAHIYVSAVDPGASFTAQSGYNYALPGGVPEPTQWALLIGGFGIVGVGARRNAAIARAA